MPEHVILHDKLTNPHNAHVFATDGTPISVAELAHRAHNSDFGLYMDKQPLRFATDFGYDRQTMLDDLGPDVHPIGHQNETAKHLALLLESKDYNLSSEEVGILMFKDRIHDMGESMHPKIALRIGRVVGDIPAGKKTDDERTAEAMVRKYLYSELFSDAHPEILERVEALIMHAPLEGDEKLYKLTEIAHELTTFNTAIRAKQTWEQGVFYEGGEVMQISGPDGGRTSALLGIQRGVFLRSGRKLLSYKDKHPYVQKTLQPYLHDIYWLLNTNDSLATAA